MTKKQIKAKAKAKKVQSPIEKKAINKRIKRIKKQKQKQSPIQKKNYLNQIAKKETNAKITSQVEEDVAMNLISHTNGNNVNVQINESQPNESNVNANGTSETLIEKNGAIVDKFIPDYLNYHVVLDINRLYNSKAFSCTLNYSNITHNNNKFYIIQLIQEDKSEKYYIFLRWGRVGRKGQTNLIKMNNLNDAIEFFLSKFESKTQYGYEEVNIDFSSTQQDSTANKAKLKQLPFNQCDDTIVNTTLSPQVIELLRLIYNITIMNDQLKEIGFDSSRLPLGKISKETIIEGYVILQKIEKVINKETKGDLRALSSSFYTKIPHNFGFLHLSSFSINTMEKLQEKIRLLESLKDIKVATKIIDEGKGTELNNNDREVKESIEEEYYNQLNCFIKPIEIDSYPILSQYLEACESVNPHLTLVLLEAFELTKREDQLNSFNNSIGNVKLLWYGTRITNYVSLLKKGFRIAPPEAPSSNFPFGKGIYFSDMSMKASSSCYPSNDIGLLLLCEVALGNCYETTKTDSSLPTNLPEGMHSVKGCGMHIPQSEVKENAIGIPIGKAIKNTEIKVSSLLLYHI